MVTARLVGLMPRDLVAQRGSGATVATRASATSNMSSIQCVDANSIRASTTGQPTSIFRSGDAAFVTDAAMSLHDLKDVVGVLPQFSGKDSDWEEFRFRLESLAALLRLREPMRKAVRTSEADLVSLADAWIPGAVLLFNLLVQHCQGRALTILKTIRDSNGFLAWKLLWRNMSRSPQPGTMHF